MEEKFVMLTSVQEKVGGEVNSRLDLTGLFLRYYAIHPEELKVKLDRC